VGGEALGGGEELPREEGGVAFGCDPASALELDDEAFDVCVPGLVDPSMAWAAGSSRF